MPFDLAHAGFKRAILKNETLEIDETDSSFWRRYPGLQIK
jgi:hypothetical protein